jgi:hypothetical protein
MSPEQWGEILIFLGLDDFPAAVITVGADVMTQMDFTGFRVHRQRRTGQKIMRAVHTALGWRFFVLLDCHGVSP